MGPGVVRDGADGHGLVGPRDRRPRPFRKDAASRGRTRGRHACRAKRSIRTLEIANDALVGLVEVVGDIGDFHRPGRPAGLRRFGNWRKTRFGHAILGDDDLLALFGGVDQGGKMRLGFVKIDRSSSCPKVPGREGGRVGQAGAGVPPLMPLERHQRAHRHVQRREFFRAAEVGQVDDEAGGDHVGAELAQELRPRRPPCRRWRSGRRPE